MPRGGVPQAETVREQHEGEKKQLAELRKAHMDTLARKSRMCAIM